MEHPYVLNRPHEHASPEADSLELVLRHSPLGFALIDRSFRYVRINEKLAELNRHSVEEHLGKTIREMVPHLAPQIEERVRHVFVRQAAVLNEELTGSSPKIPSREGQWLVTYYPIPLRDPQYVGVMVTEVSDRKAASDQLRQFACELSRSNRELEQYAYQVANELHEPLRMVSCFLNLLAKRRQGQWNPASEEYLKFARDGATRLKARVEDLLAYARMDLHEVGTSLVSSAALVDEALNDMRQIVQRTQATVKILNTLPMLVGDRVQLSQLFTHLIGNALKFNRERPEVRISAERDKPGFWHFYIEDNGIGIPPEHHERVFLIFQRLHTAKEFPGEGTGLAICRKAVERHGGKIWPESKPEGGTKVHFTLRGK